MSELPAPPGWLRRVTFVCRQIPERGGGGTAVEVLSDSLVEAGVEVDHISVFPGTRESRFPTIVLFRLGSAHRSSAVRAAIGVLAKARGLTLVAMKRLDLWRGRRRLRRYMSGAGPDTVFVFSNVSAKRVLDQSRLPSASSTSILIGQHHASHSAAEWSGELEACAVHFADVDAFVALTDDDAERFQQSVLAPCHAIPNIAPNPSSPTQPGPVCVALARYSVEKQLDVMIRAFTAATAHERLRHWRLELYGEGDKRNELEQLISELGVGERVRLMGHTVDVAGALQAAALHLLTSTTEGLPMAILEAASMGVPTVAYDCSAGVRDLVSSETGILVPAEDVSGFTQALVTLMKDEPLREQKGAAAQLLARQYAAGPVLAQWFSLFEQCATRRSVAPGRT